MIDTFETLKAELGEAVARLQPHYPGATGDLLHRCATELLTERYAKGRWPTDDEILAAKKARDAKKAA